jgi:aspartate/methionine/tyrosine aminotransferase
MPINLRFSKRTKIPAPASIAINALAKEKTQKGEKIFNLSAGEPAITKDMSYPSPQGMIELRHAAADWAKQELKTNFKPENVLITAGGKYGLYLSILALINDGDEVLIPSPYYVSYPQLVTLAGGKPVFVKTTQEKGWKLNIETAKKLCTKKTKLLIINNGSNPTGALYTDKEMKEIVNFARKKNLWIISDEVYSGFVYDNLNYASIGKNENAIIVHSMSKNFAMPGLRIGFVFASEEMIKTLTILQSQTLTGVSTINQKQAINALKKSHKITPKIRKEMQKRRDTYIKTMWKYLRIKRPPPPAALYDLLPLSDLSPKDKSDDVKFCKTLLEKTGVALVPGSAFGAKGFVRIAFCAEKKDIKKGIKTLAKYLKTI